MDHWWTIDWTANFEKQISARTNDIEHQSKYQHIIDSIKYVINVGVQPLLNM